MATVDQSLPLRELHHHVDADEKQEQQKRSYRHSLCSHHEHEHDTYDDTIFDPFYDDVIDTSVTTKQQPAMSAKEESVSVAPALPERSALRASRLLDNFMLSMVPAPTPTTSTVDNTPHDLYLSSEEDASSEAEDLSDYEPDSESEEPEQREQEQEQARMVPLRRRSRETTARVVSVIFAGKPSIVTVSTASTRRSISSGSLNDALGRRQSSSLASSIAHPSRSASPASSAASRRMSTSSVSSAANACPAASAPLATMPPPQRTSSLTLASLLSRPKPAFLTIDPFAAPPTLAENEQTRGEAYSLKSPKTPTGMFKRTLSLVRKRSRPALNTSASLVFLPTEQTQAPEKQQHEEELQTPREVVAPVTEQMPMPATAPAPVVPITYQEILKAAKKNAALPSPVAAVHSAPVSPAVSTPTGTTRKMFSGFSMNRRRSLKAS